MTETLQLEEPLQVDDLHDAPRLLVEWTPRWQDFVTSIKPALSRSTARLAGETPFGLRPYRSMIVTCAVEALLIFIAVAIDSKLAEIHPYIAPKLSSHDVIYYSGNELPQVEDLGGAQAGAAGRAGGDEAHNPTQTIRIARGGALTQRIVDAPNLKLPSSNDAVANLLAIKPNAGPPPVEGLRSLRNSPSLSNAIVAPAPNVIRDYTRGGVSLDTVVAPAPSVSRDKPLVAPSLNSGVVAPAPSVARDHALVAPQLAPNVIAPAADPFREKARSAPQINASVIPPAPGAVQRDSTRTPSQLATSAVIPPPVSAPERDTARNARLNMPAPSVIAPPPSTLSSDLHRVPGGSIADPTKSVVQPPPPTPSGTASTVSSFLGKIFGTTTVVPPPPTVSSGGAIGGNSASLPANVVPPPAAVSHDGQSGGARTGRSGTSLASNVVAPPAAVSGSGTSGTGRTAAGSLATNVVPPPPTLSGSGGGAGNNSGAAGHPNGTLLSGNVVPPPPSVGGGDSLAGLGRGNKGLGSGAPFDAGSVSAPAGGSDNGGKSSVVISNQPGSKVGLPSGGSTGSLAMSPSGGDKSGLGGSGGGTSIGHGNGPGSGMAGPGTGAGKTGAGHGSDPNAHGGISPTNGPGGAGTATSGNPPVPGVSIQGGSGIVNLPSFGAEGASDPRNPTRSSVKAQPGPAITIVATSRSGGAFNFYGKLPGDNYTVYVDSPLGMVVMQFADPTSATHSYSGALIGPQALRTDLPAGLPHARMVVSCTLDASGNLKNLQVLEPGPATMTAKVMAALPNWKFRPATRENKPVEVNAILGFGIDTNDRY